MQFTALVNRLDGLSAEAILDCFISGLQDDISRDIKAMEARTLTKVVALAKLFEEKYSPAYKQKFTSYIPKQATNTCIYPPKHPQHTPKPEFTTKPSLPPLLPTPNIKPFPTKNHNIRKISPAEIQLRREKNMCYFCEEKFSPSHKCSNRQLMLLQLSEEEPPPVTVPSVNAEVVETDDTHHLSLNVMKGSMAVGTIQFTGQIGTIQVKILVDGGSSDNFIQPRVAQVLKLPIEPSPSLRVLVGNGQMLTAEGLIQQLPLQIQGQKIKVLVYL